MFGKIRSIIIYIATGILILFSFFLSFIMGRKKGIKQGVEKEKTDNLKEVVNDTQAIKAKLDEANNLPDDAKREWLHKQFPRD
jgi:flagellar basal body-associated protein FliL